MSDESTTDVAANSVDTNSDDINSVNTDSYDDTSNNVNVDTHAIDYKELAKIFRNVRPSAGEVETLSASEDSIESYYTKLESFNSSIEMLQLSQILREEHVVHAIRGIYSECLTTLLGNQCIFTKINIFRENPLDPLVLHCLTKICGFDIELRDAHVTTSTANGIEYWIDLTKSALFIANHHKFCKKISSETKDELKQRYHISNLRSFQQKYNLTTRPVEDLVALEIVAMIRDCIVCNNGCISSLQLVRTQLPLRTVAYLRDSLGFTVTETWQRTDYIGIPKQKRKIYEYIVQWDRSD